MEVEAEALVVVEVVALVVVVVLEEGLELVEALAEVVGIALVVV